MWFSEINGYRGERIMMKKRSKRFKSLMKLSEKEKRLSAKEILEIVKKVLAQNLTSQLMFH